MLDEVMLEDIRQRLYIKLRIPDILKTEIEIKGVKHVFESLFHIISILGIGSFGVVLEVYNIKTAEVNALKILLKENSKAIFRPGEETVEQQVLRDIQHENIIFFKRVLFSIDHIFIEMEKCNAGTLESLINQRKRQQKSFSS